MSGCRRMAASWSPNCARQAKRWSRAPSRFSRSASSVSSRYYAKDPRSCCFSTALRQRRAAPAGRWLAAESSGSCSAARYVFSVTSALIALLAAGMAAQAIAFLEQANILTALDQTVWDTSWILSDSSLLGKALHALVGYVDQPTAMQLVVYTTTLAVIIVLMKLFSAPAQQRPRTA